MSTKRSGQKRSATEVTAQMICDHISTSRFVAGQRLPEGDIVEQLGVSKTVVREAFAKLHEEGILELQMFKGATVRRLSINEVIEILDVNSALLAWGMQRAAAAIAVDPNRANVIEAARVNLRELDPHDQREHLAAFYAVVETIIELAESAYFAKLVRRGLNPLLKEFLLNSLSTKAELVAHTRKLGDVLGIVARGDGRAAFAAICRWSDINAKWIREAFEERERVREAGKKRN